jgi:hypothetical protein
MTARLRIYIAGPMTGLPEWNFPAFNQAAADLIAVGHHPLNPASSFGGCPDFPREAYVRENLQMLLRADAVALLPGWSKSAGTMVELQIARELNLSVYPIEAYLA